MRKTSAFHGVALSLLSIGLWTTWGSTEKNAPEQPTGPASSAATFQDAEHQDASSDHDTAGQDATGHDVPVVDELPPHARAPRNVSLNVDQDTWLRAPGSDWFAKQAKLTPGRYTYHDNLVGDQGGWWDTTGEYVMTYDENEGEYAYWQHISAARLTLGRRDFVQFCASCHGFNGDGYGRSGQFLRPSPRSFLQSNFKFTKVLEQLPTDAALLALIKRGLDGTPMYPWDLSDEVLLDIIQYIKSLSPPERGWRDIFATIGDPVEAGEDPYKEMSEADARNDGERVYHGVANCFLCHPAYASTDRLRQLRGDARGTAYRENLHLPVSKESNFEVLGRQVQIMPPDFTWHQLRAGTSVQELFGTIASGIKGTAMPQWKGGLSDRDIWAMAHYVQGLIEDYKDQPLKRAAYMSGLRGE